MPLYKVVYPYPTLLLSDDKVWHLSNDTLQRFSFTPALLYALFTHTYHGMSTELTLHYLKLSRLKITNFHLFMPTHHTILIIRLTKRTTLHCSSPATTLLTHPTCTMLVHKAHACAETRCTPPSLSLSLSLPGYIYLLQTTTYQTIRWPNGFVEGQPIALQSWIRQLTSYSQPHRGSYRVRHYSNTT